MPVLRYVNRAITFALVALLFGGMQLSYAQDATVNLVFATTMDDSGIDRALREFFDARVRELSDDSIHIDFFMAGQLGSEREALEQLQLGEIDLGYNVIQAELYYPQYDVISMPFLFPDLASMQAFMRGPIGDNISRLARERGGVIPMGMHGYGARWTTSNRPFSNAEELQGLRIRMPNIRAWVEVWAGMGARPTPIAATEIVTSLQTGVVDAQENFLTNIVGRQMWEYQRYLIRTEHVRLPQTWLVSERSWNNKLSEAQRQALQQAIEDTIAHAAEIVDALNEEFVATAIANGMTLIEPDQESLRQAALPHIQRVIDEELADGVYEEALRIIGAN